MLCLGSTVLSLGCYFNEVKSVLRNRHRLLCHITDGHDKTCLVFRYFSILFLFLKKGVGTIQLGQHKWI